MSPKKSVGSHQGPNKMDCVNRGLMPLKSTSILCTNFTLKVIKNNFVELSEIDTEYKVNSALVKNAHFKVIIQ